MNRRNFISLLAGAAGAGVVLWRLPERRIFLPPAPTAPRDPELVTVDASWLADPAALDELRTAIARSIGLPRQYVFAEPGYNLTGHGDRVLSHRFSFTPLAIP